MRRLRDSLSLCNLPNLFFVVVVGVVDDDNDDADVAVVKVSSLKTFIDFRGNATTCFKRSRNRRRLSRPLLVCARFSIIVCATNRTKKDTLSDTFIVRG